MTDELERSSQLGERSNAREPLLEVRDLYVGFPTLDGTLLAANRVNLSVRSGEVLGLVGESGSGKTVTCRSLIGLVPKPGETLSGEIVFDGRDLLQLSARELRRIRAHEIGMVFQDPASFLNPVYKVGDQISETLRVNLGMKRKEARTHGIELLRRVGIPSPDARFHDYPHQLSGGMQQRVMIALAIAPEPRLLLADEPTTALDVTIQAQILALLSSLQSETGMAMILVSHDFGVIAQHCHSVAVMYAGYVVEYGSVETIFSTPRHPYTQALLRSLLPLEARTDRTRLVSIPGQTPNLARLPAGCPFGPRCNHVRPTCSEVEMGLEAVGPEQLSACPFAPSDADGGRASIPSSSSRPASIG